MMRPMVSGRAGFTPADLAFVESALAGDGGRDALRRLCQDDGALSDLLDLKAVHRALLECPVALPVSPSLYFYVLVRHAFLDGGIDDRELADYVAGVLAAKIPAHPDPTPGAMPGWVTHAVDFVAVIRNTHGMLRFHLEVAAADQFLVLTGLFPDFLQSRALRRGAPGLPFYEAFARQSYRHAAGCGEATPDSRRIFGLLAEVFPIARASLNRMSDRCLFL